VTLAFVKHSLEKSKGGIIITEIEEQVFLLK